MSIFGRSIKYWIPDELITQDLYQQFIMGVDWLMSNDYTDSDKLSYRYSILVSKYKSVMSIPIADVYAFFEEIGYSYILDLTNLDEDLVRTFLYFMNYIHVNKGTKVGLDFIFNLLKVDYTATEWFDVIPTAEPFTYTIDSLKLRMDSVVNISLINTVTTFLKNYVYPLLKGLKMEYIFASNQMNFGVIYGSTSSNEIRTLSKFMIWDEDDWDTKIWGDGGSPLTFDTNNWDETEWG